MRAGDIENNVTDIAQIPVIFDCNDDGDDPAIGDIVTPEHMELVAGIVEVTGFARRHEDHCERSRSGSTAIYIGDADFGLPSPEFEELYPWLPSSVTRNSGFRYELDTVAANLADGEHSLVVWTEDRYGRPTASSASADSSSTTRIPDGEPEPVEPRHPASAGCVLTLIEGGAAGLISRQVSSRGDEAPWPGGFPRLGARSVLCSTLSTHCEETRLGRCIVGRSRQLVRYAGYNVCHRRSV